MTNIPTLAFHVPDGFLTLPVIIVAWVLLAISLAYFLRAGKHSFNESIIPTAGITAAFVFGVQAINFPVFGGTSAHLVGATLAVLVLGLPTAVVVMTVVVFLQVLLFNDGGVLTFGVNALNLAIIAPVASFLAFKIVSKLSNRWKKSGKYMAAGIATWVAVMLTAFFLALELTLSGTTTPEVIFPVLLGINALAGIVEGIATAAALAVVSKARVWNSSRRIGANT